MDMLGWGFFNSVFPVLFALVFLLVAGLIVYAVVEGIAKSAKNAAAPRLTVAARVVGKRDDHHRHAGTNHTAGHGWTIYFATFEVESGDRMELELSGEESGLLAEGDRGALTFQGTRFIAFDRER